MIMLLTDANMVLFIETSKFCLSVFDYIQFLTGEIGSLISDSKNKMHNTT